jgi:hypothetical protein
MWLAWLGDDHRLGEGTKLLHYIPRCPEDMFMLMAGDLIEQKKKRKG